MRSSDWFEAPAAAYDRHVGRYGPRLAAELVAFAGLPDGARALDVGCGPGALTRVLADRLGAGNVAAADPSAAFADACRLRVRGAEVVVAPGEQLPFADDTFDVALAQLVVNFMDDPRAGVAEMMRATRPGGVVAACVWDDRGEMTLLRAFWDAALEVAPERAAAIPESAGMPLCRPGALTELWESAGLDDVRAGTLAVSVAYDSFEDLWAPLPAGPGPSGAFCQALDEPQRAALHDAYKRVLGVGDGPFELGARAWAAAGTVPAGGAGAAPTG